MVAIVSELAPPPSSRRPDVPRAVDAIVQRLLAKSMTERFQTAAEVVEAIEHVSMRAATLLSTSAVSRLLHDLFGAPPEPWLELDGDTIPFQAATQRSSSAPVVLDPAAIEEVEHALAAAPDLTTPMADASAWIVAPVVQSAPVVLPKPPAAVSVTAAPIPPSGAATVVVAPRVRAGSASVSNPIAAEIVPSRPDPRPPHAPHSASGALPGSLATTTRRTAVVPAAQISWPLVAVIATALVSGVSAVWLSTGDEPPRTPARGVALPVAADSEVVDAAEAARATPAAAPKPVEVAPSREPSPAAEITATPDPVPPVRSPRSPPDDAVLRRGPAATRERTPTAAPLRSPTTALARGATPAFKTLSALYQAKDYAGVAACGRISMTGDVARLCVLAACNQHNALAARRWFTASSPEHRAQLVASCKQAGNLELAVH
jgi:serine/threonine-protein kinase